MSNLEWVCILGIAMGVSTILLVMALIALDWAHGFTPNKNSSQRHPHAAADEDDIPEGTH